MGWSLIKDITKKHNLPTSNCWDLGLVSEKGEALFYL